MIRALFTITLVIAGVCTSSAQQGTREDRRISPLEPYSLRLPDDQRIESATSIGSSTLVVWGTRDAAEGVAVRPTLRMQIMRDGSPVASPVLLHSLSARPARLVRVIAEGNGFNVFWYDQRENDTGLFRQRVDLDGSRVGEETKVIDGKIIDMVTYHDLPRLTLLLREGAPAVLMLPDGSIDASGLEQKALTVPHIIEADSSIVSVEGDSVFFRSSFRNGVITHRLPLPDSAVLRGTEVIGKNASGEIILTWIAQPADPFHYYPASYAAIVYLAMQSRIVEKSRYESATTIDTLGAANSSSCSPGAHIGGTTRRNHSGGFLVTLRLFISVKCPGQPGGSIDLPATFHVSHDAAYRRSNLPTLRPDRADELPLVRLRADTLSTVGIVAEVDTIALSAPIAPRSTGVAQQGPALLTRGGKLLVAWHDRGYDGTVRAPYDTSGGNRLHIPVRRDITYGGDVEEVIEASSHALVDGMVVNELKVTYYRGKLHFGTHRLFAATANRWQLIFSRVISKNVTKSSYARDPNNGLTSGVTDPAPNRRSFFSFADDGRMPASFEHTLAGNGSLWMIPADSATFLLVNGSVLLRATVSGIDTIASIVPAEPSAIERFDRVYGEYFVRTTLAADRLSITAERYRLDGSLLESRSIPLQFPATDISIALDSRDSSIFILSGSSRGVRMTHLAPDLAPLQIDVRTSVTEAPVRNATGAVVGDSLHVAWEDDRVGNSDIFGQVLGAPFDGISHVESLPVWSGADSPVMPVTLAGITPNPAGDIVSLNIRLVEAAEVVLEIQDMSGRISSRATKRLDAGESQWDIDIHDLANGTYIISLNSGNSIDMKKLVVMRK